MAAYTDSIGFYKGEAAYPGMAGMTPVSHIEVELQFAKIVAARLAAGATALAATDTLQVLQLPANSVVLHAGMEVVRAETTNTTATFDLGFTGGSPAAANVFVNDGASNALAVLHSALAAPVLISTAADTIDLLLNTAVPANAIIRVFALVYNPN